MKTMSAMARTLAEKVWERHVVHRAEGEPDLLYVDLHLVHEVTSPQAFGALAIGIGTSEVEHVLATQTLPQSKPGTMAVTVEGELPEGVSAKDVILAIIGRIGTGG